MPRRDIGVDVERLTVVARRDGRYDGDVVVIDEVLEVCLLYTSDAADD